jgi:hypothetical protein
LFNEKTEIPESLKELAFEPSVLPLKMLVRTVSEYFAGQKSRCDLSVAVIDVSAKVCDVLPLLARQVRYVRVITSRADKYDLCADTIYKTLGISVEISDDETRNYVLTVELPSTVDEDEILTMIKYKSSIKPCL